MRRVLFLAPQPFYAWRGSPIRVGYDLQALAMLGYEIDLVTLPIGRPWSHDGVRIHRLSNPFGVERVPIGPSWPKLCFDFLMMFKVAALLRRNRYDVIHGVEEAGAIAAWFGRGRAAVVYEKHSDPQSHRDSAFVNAVLWVYARVERWTARRAHAVVGTGPGLVEQMGDVAPGRVHQISDIPSSLEEPRDEAVAAVRRQLDPRGDAVVIAYVGSYAVYQGVDLMFESIPLVLAKHPHARFLIIGGQPSDVAERRAWLQGRGVEAAVTFIERVPPEELPAYLRASDILLSPRMQGINTPLKVLDYFKAGRAVLASDTASNRLLLDERVAMLAAPRATAFAAGMTRLIEDRVLREKLGKAGRQLIDTTYNFPEFRRQLEACYVSALRNAGR